MVHFAFYILSYMNFRKSEKFIFFSCKHCCTLCAAASIETLHLTVSSGSETSLLCLLYSRRQFQHQVIISQSFFLFAELTQYAAVKSDHFRWLMAQCLTVLHLQDGQLSSKTIAHLQINKSQSNSDTPMTHLTDFTFCSDGPTAETETNQSHRPPLSPPTSLSVPDSPPDSSSPAPLIQPGLGKIIPEQDSHPDW